ncbi:MAG: hypothetical protein V1694_03980 [Candidatus Eisenbacteria bacterium]
MALRKSRPVTIADLKHLATRADLKNFATKADVKGLAAKNDVDFLRVDLKFLRDDFASYRSEFAAFKDWMQTILARVVKDIEDVKQEVGVLTDARLRRLHDRLTKVEGKVGLPTEEYF